MQDGGRDRDRTCDPVHIEEALLRRSMRPVRSAIAFSLLANLRIMQPAAASLAAFAAAAVRHAAKEAKNLILFQNWQKYIFIGAAAV